MIVAIIIPDVGEGVVSGKVVAVHLKIGDMIAVDDTVVELETDKAVVEIPSTAKGKVVEVLVREGQELKVGDAIAQVETEAATSDREDPSPTPEPAQKSVQEARSAIAEPTPSLQERTAPVAGAERTAPAERDTPLQPVPASPSIRRLARELGVNIHEVQGSGPGGRISDVDIQSYVKQRLGAPTTGSGRPFHGAEPELPDFTRWGEIESVDMEAVRRITAQSTTTSWQTIPHVTQFDKADISELDDLISKNTKRVSQGGGKLTVTAIIAKVCAKALIKFPRFNASIDLKHERLIYKKYVHISIAVDTQRGLLMPVIANADTLSITELAAAIMDLAERSRNKKIKATELDGGTFSISNQGGIGGVAFTPIVLWPQVAILGVSRASIEPKYLDGGFQPRKILPLSLSYDHRIIDGADASRFLRWVCESLENAFTMHLD